MQNFQDKFETHKGPFISAFPICMTIPLSYPFLINALNAYVVDMDKRLSKCNSGKQFHIHWANIFFHLIRHMNHFDTVVVLPLLLSCSYQLEIR